MSEVEQLHIDVIADGTETAALSYSKVLAALERMEAQLAKNAETHLATGRAAAQHGAAETRAAEGIGVTTASVEKLNPALDLLAGHYRMVSAGAEVFGLEATAAAAKVTALTEVVGGLEKACLPLLIALVALEAGAKAFEFIKGGTEAAGAMQAQMETLGAAVETQGGNWENLSKQIEAWVAQESMATGILRAELIPALNELVTAGHNVADAETILAVAEEVAIAKHRQVSEVVSDLIAGELGRWRGIEKLDPAVRALTQAHKPYSEILEKLHKDSEKALEDDKSLERAHGRLKSEIEAVGLVIGNKLLPIMADMNYTFLGAIKNAELLAKGIGDSFASIPMEVGGVVTALMAIPDALKAAWGAISHGDFKGAASAMGAAFLKDTQAGLAQIRAGQAMSDRGASEMFNEIFHGVSANTQGRHVAGNAVAAHRAGLDKRIERVKAIPPPKPTKDKAAGSPGSSTSFSYTPNEMPKVKGNDEMAEHQKLLLSIIAETADLTEKRKLLTAAYGEAVAEQQGYDDTVKFASEALKKAGEEENRYDEAIRKRVAAGGAAETSAETNRVAELHDKVKKLTTILAEATAAAKEHRDIIAADSTALAANAAAIAAVEAAHKKAAEAAEKAWTKWSESEAQRMAETLATFKMTNAEKVLYYARMLDGLDKLDVDYDAKKKDLIKRRDDAEIAEYEDRIKAHDAMVKTIEDRERGYLDGIIMQHRSLRDTLKNIFNDILGDFVHMIEEMILKSALLKGVSGFFSNLLGGGASSSGFSAGAGSLLSTVPGLGFGPGAPGNSASNPLYTLVQASGAPFNTAITGSSTGVSSGGLSALAGGGIGSILTLVGGALGIGSMVGGAVGGPGAPNASMNGALGGLLGAGGVMAGMMALSGGSLMGVLAGMGPIGWAALLAGAIGGGALGGMIGPHWGPASNYPDRGPGAADYQAWLSSFNGGPGGVGDKTEALIRGIDPKQLSGQALADYQKLLALEGGTGQLGIKDEHDGFFTLVSGLKVAVTDFRTTVDRFGQEVSGLGDALVQTFTLTRTYPDFNIANVTPNSGAAGGASDGSGSGTGTGGSTGGGKGGGGRKIPGSGDGGDTYVDLSGAMIVGPGGLDEVALAISQAQRRVDTGEVAGGSARSTLNTRFST